MCPIGNNNNIIYLGNENAVTQHLVHSFQTSSKREHGFNLSSETTFSFLRDIVLQTCVDHKINRLLCSSLVRPMIAAAEFC